MLDEEKTPIDLEEVESRSLEKQYTKYNRCSWCCGVTSVILVILGSLTPYLMNMLIQMGAKKSTTLTAANEQSWNGIPGYYDIGVYWKHYMYNLTNYDDVSMK
jgi:hypothetical protein